MLRFPPLGPVPGLLRSLPSSLPLLAISGLLGGSLLGGCAWIPPSDLDDALNQLGDIDLELSTVPDDWDACVDQYTYVGTVEGRYALEVFDATLSADDLVLATERVSASQADGGRAEVTVEFDPVVGLPIEGGPLTLTVTFEHGDGASEADTFEIQVTPAPTRFEDIDDDGVGGDPILTCDAAIGVPTSGDCDDDDPDRTPGAVELCDLIDNDCDGALADFEADDDDDGYTACDPAFPDDPTQVWDCDDNADGVHPGVVENAALADNGIDDDCNGADLCYADTDDDGFAATVPGIQVDLSLYDSCTDAIGDLEVAPAPASPDDIDCDDTETPAAGESGVIYPGAPELCDGLDNDCDLMMVGEDDQDGDGFRQCDGDCEDTVATVFPDAAIEICDGYDTDCSEDGLVPSDERDDDGDGFVECSPPIGSTLDGGDCDDTDIDTYPGAPELCDGADNDCANGTPADETTDVDGDGFFACEDCNDGESSIKPDAMELVGNDIDENCDELWDCWEDDDEDGFGNEAQNPAPDQTMPCSDVVGVSADSTDCNDDDVEIYPGAPERCNGIDDDCDGALPDDEMDPDGDTYAACVDIDGPGGFKGGDCRPDLANVNPGELELCTPLDEDCNGDAYGDALHIGIIPDANPEQTEGFAQFPPNWSPTQAVRIEVCGPTEEDEDEDVPRRITIASAVTIRGMTNNPSLGVSLAFTSEDATIENIDLEPIGVADTSPGGVIQHTGGGLLTVTDTAILCTAEQSPPALDCDASAPGIVLPSSGGAISSPNLEMVGSEISNCWSSGAGGALYIDGTADLTSVTLYDNVAHGSGGAIAVENGGLLTLDDVVIQGNDAGTTGGGLSLGNSANLTATGTRSTMQIDTNQACDDGGGLALLGGNTTVLTGLTVSGNTSWEGRGGGLFADTADLDIDDMALSGNMAVALNDVDPSSQTGVGAGGGAWTSIGAVPMMVTNTDVVSNMAEIGGGWTVIADEDAFFEGTLFSGNADTALYVFGGQDVTLADSTFDVNWTDRDTSASAIYIDDATVVLSSDPADVVFTANAVPETTNAGLIQLAPGEGNVLCACSTDFGQGSEDPPAATFPPDGTSPPENYGGIVSLDGVFNPLAGDNTTLTCDDSGCTTNECPACPP